MFTRYRGTSVPENYSGVRFRDSVAPPTEMKTHKPAPSYTSTKTSVSPAFRSAQLQRSRTNQSKAELNVPPVEAELSTPSSDTLQGMENGAWEKNANSFFTVQDTSNFPPFNEFENTSACTECQDGENDDTCKESDACDKTRKARKELKCETNDFRTELGTLLSKIFSGIKSDDFLLLAVMLLILGADNECDGETKCQREHPLQGGFGSLFKSEAKGALLPLALLLLYS